MDLQNKFCRSVQLVIATIVFSALTTGHAHANSKTNDLKGYAKKVKFVAGAIIEFPDFMLSYQGVGTYSALPLINHSHVFSLHGGGASGKLVTWDVQRSATQPLKFEVAGKTYVLELVSSADLGALQADELVLKKVEFK